MRISDWSSDVCSSDLLWRGAIELGRRPVERLHPFLGKRRMMGGDRRAKLAGAVERQLCAEHLGQCAEDLPVFPRLSGREDGALPELYAASKVHPGSGLFGIRVTRPDDRESVVVGQTGTIRREIRG